MSAQQEADITEAIAWCSKAIKTLSTLPGERRYQLSVALTQRGCANMLKDDLDAALADFEGSIKNNPDDATARFNRLTIKLRLERSDDTDNEALYLLERPEHRRHVLRNYAAYLGEKGRIEDLERLAQEYSRDFAETLETGFILALARDANRRPFSKARLFLHQWRKSRKDVSHGWLRAWAYVLTGMGHVSRAQRVLEYSLRIAGDDVISMNAAHALAMLYAQQAQWTEACATYRGFVRLSSYSPDLPEYLYAQMRAEGVSSAVETIVSKLPATVRAHPSVLFLWAQMEQTRGNVPLAARLFMRLWRQHGAEESAVHCAHCLYRLPQTRRRADVVLRAIRHFDRMRPEVAMMAASLLAEFDHFHEAVSVAYSIASRHQANRVVQERYAALVLIQCNNRLDLTAGAAALGNAVDVEVRGEKQCWLLAPPAGEPILPNCEAINEKKILNAIVGRRQGDSFTFAGRDGDSIHGVIRQVRRKELKLLHEVLDHARVRPDDTSMFHAVSANVQSLVAELNKHVHDQAGIVQSYREKNWPLVWLAAACNRQPIEVFWAALNGNVGPVDAFPGNVQCMTRHVSAAASGVPFLLDLQALQIIARFDLLFILDPLRARCLVCQSAVDQLTAAIQASKMSQDSEHTIAADGIGGVVVRDIPESERGSYRSHLAKCDAFIRSLGYGQVLSSPVGKSLPDAASQVLSQPIVDMIEISRERAVPILLGDMRLAGLVRDDLQFSVRTVIDAARQTNTIAVERVAATLGEMKLTGLQYVSVSEEILLASSDLLITEQKSAAFSALISQLSPSKSDWNTSLPIMAKCISTFAIMRWLGDNQRQSLVAAALSAALGDSYQRQHFVELTALVRVHLHLAPIQLKATLQTFRVWDDMKSRARTTE